ncbi:MAG: hypothetical protein J7540_09480 [Roseofilum sp. SID2]|uniref:hypothetical protein n=1 Tax=unclassified Roseofilum TaxID=2620099 RepID=UPI001B026639|nr:MULTISPECIES: hypothetical protein [unclassified Roseofilum]MBP0024213.1 hypothetical protein [Roseofilum sp. SID2]MBP0035435.1 hypothetical protein [Roseofilum sp. Belize BBD 4]
MAQVLVPVYVSTLAGTDDGQYYKYFEESEVPGLNRFRIKHLDGLFVNCCRFCLSFLRMLYRIKCQAYSNALF